jgi:tRNA modification GTPase
LPDNIPVLEIINKADLLNSEKNVWQKNQLKNRLLISAKTGRGLKQLKEQIKRSLGISSKLADTLSVTTNRQYQSLNNCLRNIKSASQLLGESEIAYELVSIEIQEALNNLGAILGKTTADDILDNIFNQFCVGK